MSALSRSSAALPFAVVLATCAATAALWPGRALADEVAFSGESRLFSDFEFDSGFQPEGSPVQLRVVFNLGGGLSARARGEVTADGEGQVSLAGVPGSGRYELDVGPQFQVFLKLGFSVLGRDIRYEGPIPISLPLPTQLDYRFAGAVDFDPFLLDGTAAVVEDEVQDTTVVEIPITDALVPIPGIGGSLILELGGRLRSELTGVSAGMSPPVREGDVVRSEAYYRARVRHTGQVLIKPGVRISLLTFSRDISLTLPVTLPAIEQDLDLGTVPVSLAVPDEGSSPRGGTPPGPLDGPVGSGGGGGSAGGGGEGPSGGSSSGGEGQTDDPSRGGPGAAPDEEEGMSGGCGFAGRLDRGEPSVAPWLLLALVMGVLGASRFARPRR